MKSYLGDGLYFEDEGHQIRLFTERFDTVHEVFLDDSTLRAFFKCVEKARDVKIIVPNQDWK